MPAYGTGWKKGEILCYRLGCHRVSRMLVERECDEAGLPDAGENVYSFVFLNSYNNR